MTQQPATTTSRMSREMAQKIMEAGKLKRGGIEVNVYDNTLSVLPAITNDELNATDFIINLLAGDITTKFGPAWIFEVGNRPNLSTHSWLVGQKSVIGDNLQKLANRRGGFSHVFPLWVHLAHYTPDEGQPYWCLETPIEIRNALEESTPNNGKSELDDLPF